MCLDELDSKIDELENVLYEIYTQNTANTAQREKAKEATQYLLVLATLRISYVTKE